MLLTQTWNDEFLRWNVGNYDDDNEDTIESVGEY